MGKSRNSDISRFLNQSARSEFLPELPNVNGSGGAKAAVLNHSVVLGSGRLGSPTTFARTLPLQGAKLPTLGMSDEMKTLYGKPEVRVSIPFSCQPPTR